jgi:hypothetical protein
MDGYASKIVCVRSNLLSFCGRCFRIRCKRYCIDHRGLPFWLLLNKVPTDVQQKTSSLEMGGSVLEHNVERHFAFICSLAGFKRFTALYCTVLHRTSQNSSYQCAPPHKQTKLLRHAYYSHIRLSIMIFV